MVGEGEYTMSIHKFDHHIQAEIFARLRASDTLRYRDLKDPALESSQFMYHLKELSKRDLVEKNENGHYKLTPKGISLAQYYSSEKAALNPGTLSYTMLFLRSKNGKWLLVKRKRQPFYDCYAAPSGKIHTHETLKQAATRELTLVTDGKIENKLQYKGYASILTKNKFVQTHITGPIWFMDNCEEFDVSKITAKNLLWADWKTLPYKEFIPGWQEIVAMIEDGEPSYLDLEFTT